MNFSSAKIIGFLFFLFSFINKAQNIDSLKQILTTKIDDTLRCIVLNTLVEAENDINVWPKFNDELKQLAEANISKTKKGSRLNNYYLKYLSGALNNKGYYYRGTGDIQKALEYYSMSLKVSEQIGDKKGIAGSLNNVGFVYYNLGDIPRAIDYFLQCLKLMEQINDKDGIGTSLNNIASIYDAQRDIVKAIEFYERALSVHQSNSNKMGASTTLNNIGLIYLNTRDYSKALKYFYKSMTIQKEISDKSGWATSVNNIGLVYSGLGDKEKALSYYLRSLKVQEEISDKVGILFTLNNIGSVYGEMGNHKMAEEFCKKSLLLAQELGFPENIRNSSKILHELYAKKKRYLDAYSMQSIYYSMRDSIENENNRKVSIRSQIKYAYEQKAIADSLRSMEEKKVTVALLSQERTQRYSLYGGLALVGLFGGFMFNRFRITNRQKKIIELKSLETEIQKSIIEEHQKEIIDSINYARRIQAAILPPDRLINQYLGDAFVLYLPKDIVAGDFYWMFFSSINGNKNSEEATYQNTAHEGSPASEIILFAAADCTGHGVPGAMVSVLCNNALNRSVKEFGLTDPGKILDKTREIVIEEFEKSDEDVKDGMDISLCSLNRKKMELLWAGANNPLWIIRNGNLIEKKPNKQPIGKFAENKPFDTHVISLETNDLIYIFTDGFADQFGGNEGKKFMYKNQRTLLLSLCHFSLQEQKNRLLETFNNWKGPLDQVDDICIIAIRV